MNKLDEKPVLLTKRKNVQTLIDYCLDIRLGFAVNPRAISNDEFEVEIDITNFKQAIALGMFAKENKFEVTGMGDLVKPKLAPVVVKKPEVKETTSSVTSSSNSNQVDATEKLEKSEKEEATLNFNLGSSN